MGAVHERLAHDVGGWLADGLVSKETHDLLRQRYGARAFGIAQAIKYVGISGGVLAAFGLLGLVAALTGSKGVAGMLLVIAASAVTAAGMRLSLDKLGRYATSSKVVLTLGVLLGALGIGLVASSSGLRDESAIFATGAIALPVVWFLAYRFNDVFLLVLGLLGFFHWVGTWSAMFGRSSYAVVIEDPRLVTVASLVAIALGVEHEVRRRERTGRFFQAYEAVGLVYLNLSLLLMTIWNDARWAPKQAWVVVLAAIAIGQILAGARLHNGLFTGFGVTALAVDLYTRYFETFWNRTHKGVFFLAGGASLFAAGGACELLLKRLRKVAT